MSFRGDSVGGIVSRMTGFTNIDNILRLIANQSTYIRLGSLHCLANHVSISSGINKVRSGDCRGKDNIVCLEDAHGRTKY